MGLSLPHWFFPFTLFDYFQYDHQGILFSCKIRLDPSINVFLLLFLFSTKNIQVVLTLPLSYTLEKTLMNTRREILKNKWNSSKVLLKP